MAELYGVSTSSVQRAVGAITLGTVKAYDDRKIEDWKGGMDEYDQQFRIPFQALVNYKTRWVTTLLQFDVSFVEETSRDSPYTFTPHFTWGWEFVKTRDNLA